jgi:hypothetical protein
MQRISVLAENRPGIIADITQLMADSGINILTIDGSSIDVTGVVQITVEEYDHALQLLQQAGFRAVSEEALIIRVLDEPGGLAKIASRFLAEEINICSMHILDRKKGNVLVSVVTDNNKKVKKIFNDLIV